MVAMTSIGRTTVPSESAPPPRRDVADRPVTFLFTDLYSSTALYERMGDAAAYNIVRRHFMFLGGIVFGHNGMVVKTIGDAVMATFGDPIDAVRAALTMQSRIADFNRAHMGRDADRRLVIRLGVHCGGSVRVELDDRVDYFGSAVNLAARLRGQSRGGDIVLSHVVAGYPAVRLLLATLPTRKESLRFKGFYELVRFVRVSPETGQSTGDSSVLPMPKRPLARPPPAGFALGGH
jgi:class 3 adenylate cyclase